MGRKSRSLGPRTKSNIENTCTECNNQTRHRRWCKFNKERIRMFTSPRLNHGNNNTSINLEVMENDNCNSSILELDLPVPSIETNLPSEIDMCLQNIWKEKLLPVLHKFTYAKNQSLDRQKWPDWSFKTMNPAIVNNNINSSSNILIPSTDVYVICPNIFFPHIMENYPIKCIVCKSKEVQLNGWKQSFRCAIGIRNFFS